MDLGVEYEFQSVLVDLLALSGLLSKHFVSSEECLDSRDSDWDEISPSDVTTLVFVGKGQEDPDIIITEVVRRQKLEGLEELHVGQLSILILVSLCK